MWWPYTKVMAISVMAVMTVMINGVMVMAQVIVLVFVVAYKWLY